MPRETDASQTAVILVTSFLNRGLPEPAIGGRARIVRDVARHLRQIGFTVRIIQKGPAAGALELEPGITVQTVRVPMPIWSDLLFAWQTRRAARDADLCCYATPEDGFPFFAARGFAIQHGIWWDGPDAWWKGWLVRGVQSWRNRVMCSRLRFVLCVDTQFINQLRMAGRRGHKLARKCVYCPNYADLDRFPAPTRERMEQRFASRRLLFLRRFAAPRGARLFVEMCRLLRDMGVEFRAEMAGRGPLKAEVAAAVRTAGLDSLVTLTETTLDDAPRALDACAVSVVPSEWAEGTSLSAIESLVMGIPVVATDAGALASVVTPGFNGFVCRPDPAVLASAVGRLLTDQDLYLSIARNAVSMREAYSLARWTGSLDSALGEAGLIGNRHANGRKHRASG